MKAHPECDKDPVSRDTSVRGQLLRYGTARDAHHPGEHLEDRYAADMTGIYQAHHWPPK